MVPHDCTQERYTNPEMNLQEIPNIPVPDIGGAVDPASELLIQLQPPDTIVQQRLTLDL
jgi:hypothetical protein